MMDECMDDGGQVQDEDQDAMLDQCTNEMMQAIESKDKEAFINALHVLFADFMTKMQAD